MSDTLFYLLLFVGWSLIGLIFVGVGIYTRRYQQKKEAVERSLVSGQIVDVMRRTHRSGRGGTVTYYVPVVEFQAEGRQYLLENENGSREKDSIHVGKTVDVMYDPADPTHFHLAEDDANEEASHSIIRFGVIWIIGAAALTVLSAVFGILR